MDGDDGVAYSTLLFKRNKKSLIHNAERRVWTWTHCQTEWWQLPFLLAPQSAAHGTCSSLQLMKFSISYRINRNDPVRYPVLHFGVTGIDMATRVPTIVHVSGNCFGNGRTIVRTRTVFGHIHTPSEGQVMCAYRTKYLWVQCVPPLNYSSIIYPNSNNNNKTTIRVQNIY